MTAVSAEDGTQAQVTLSIDLEWFIVKPKSSPKSMSQIQVPNPSPKSKIQSPEEREWDWGWHYNPSLVLSKRLFLILMKNSNN